MLRVTQRWLSTLQMLPQHPLIAIVGATGTGKSQLAVSLAKRFNGEIINGDALQMYEGLPTITNKIPFQERENIQHHLLGCIKLEEEPWTVKHFIDRACKVVEDIRSRDRVPILVGGTHYYTQSLIFRDAVVDEEPGCLTKEKREQNWPILDAETRDILQELYRVDPIMAMRWHPNDRRKIRRSLEVYLTTGVKASDIYEQQRAGKHNQESEEGSAETNMSHSLEMGLPLRYDTLIFWTYAVPEGLNTRLENRVDTMVSKGLLEEVRSMHDYLRNEKQRGKSPDQDRGIWTAIGLKELAPYILDENHAENVRRDCIKRTKIATRQYAKRQLRWIKLRLQRALKAAGSSQTMFLLDSSDLSQWSQAVEKKAFEVAAGFLSGSAIPQPTSLSVIAMENLTTTEALTRSARSCEACNKTLMSEMEWNGHLKSRGHKSAVKPSIDWEKLYPRRNRT